MEKKLVKTLKTTTQVLEDHDDLLRQVRGIEESLTRFKMAGKFQCFVDMRVSLFKYFKTKFTEQITRGCK
jgi:hypothetical protein